MGNYHAGKPDLQTRVELCVQMLAAERSWGTASRLAKEQGVSRKFLYALLQRAQKGLEAALSAQAPGRKCLRGRIGEEEQAVERATVVLATILPGSERKIQTALHLLFNQHRSLGWISETLRSAGEWAQRYQLALPLPREVLGEADEIFQGRQPCLTVVDGRSFLVLNLSAAEQRDATTWGCTLLDLQARGVHFHDLAADGGRGIAAGLRAAALAVPLRMDLFHMLREGHRLLQRLERQAYAKLQVEMRAQRAYQEAQAPQRRRGHPLKLTVTPAQAQAEAHQAVYHYDATAYLWHEIRQALEPWDTHGRLIDPQVARATVEAALALLEELQIPCLLTFVTVQLRPHLEELLAPQAWVRQALAPWLATVEPATLDTIVWAWSQRQALGLTTAGDGFAPGLLTTVQAIWEILSWFHRASSLAESLHSWLRPYLQVHRGIPQWLLPLLQLVWNHHVFTRGRRQGHSPMELAGLNEVPSLAELFQQLLAALPRAQPIA